MSENLVEAILSRCNELRVVYLPAYESIPEGRFAATMIRASIANAEKALGGGDVLDMIAALKDLREYKL
jgi:hypothetical protein